MEGEAIIVLYGGGRWGEIGVLFEGRWVKGGRGGGVESQTGKGGRFRRIMSGEVGGGGKREVGVWIG